MIDNTLAIFLFIVGAAMGSFVQALTYRLKVGKSMVKGRSECEHCHKQLSAWELIPIVSWILLRGRCSKCKKSIGINAILLELFLGLIFLTSYLIWPVSLSVDYNWVEFAIWLIYVVLLAGLFVYDLRWMILPDKLVFPLIVIATLQIFIPTEQSLLVRAADSLSGVIVLAGLYGLLYYVSKGKWVGFGDVKLGVFMGLALGWQGAFLALIAANLVGLIFVLPGLLSGKLNRTSKVPFGPFLIIGFMIAHLFGDGIIYWYFNGLIATF